MSIYTRHGCIGIYSNTHLTCEFHKVNFWRLNADSHWRDHFFSSTTRWISYLYDQSDSPSRYCRSEKWVSPLYWSTPFRQAAFGRAYVCCALNCTRDRRGNSRANDASQVISLKQPRRFSRAVYYWTNIDSRAPCRHTIRHNRVYDTIALTTTYQILGDALV